VNLGVLGVSTRFGVFWKFGGKVPILKEKSPFHKHFFLLCVLVSPFGKQNPPLRNEKSPLAPGKGSHVWLTIMVGKKATRGFFSRNASLYSKYYGRKKVTSIFTEMPPYKVFWCDNWLNTFRHKPVNHYGRKKVTRIFFTEMPPYTILWCVNGPFQFDDM